MTKLSNIEAELKKSTAYRKSCKQFRSTSPEVFCKKGVLRNLAKFTGKHLCQRLFFNKAAGLKLFSKTT